MKMILSNKKNNQNNTSLVDAIRFTLYDEQKLSFEDLDIIFNHHLNEKIIKICDENEHEWNGRKYDVENLFSLMDLFDENAQVKPFINKNIIKYLLDKWGNKYDEFAIEFIDYLKEFTNS